MHHVAVVRIHNLLAIVPRDNGEEMDKAKATFVITVILLFLVPCLLGTVYFWYPFKTNVHTSLQPSGVHYDHGDPYEVKVSINHRHIFEIWVSRRSSDYGHSVDFSPLGNEITVTRVDWKIDGIDVVFSSGHRVFIPKASFIGGR